LTDSVFANGYYDGKSVVKGLKRCLSWFSKLGLLLLLLVVTQFYGIILPPVALANWHAESLSAVSSRDPMTPEAMRSVIQQAADFWIKGNSRGFAALFSADGEFIVPGSRWVGVGAIERAAKEFHESHNEVEIEIQQILVENTRACVEWVWRDISLSSGKRTQAKDAIIVDFQDGKIQRWREYIDDISHSG
jgi:uncharacterized protein (TIGR02246 family)